MKNIINRIFNISNNSEFEELCLTVFKYQAKNNKVYKDYIKYRNICTKDVNSIIDIPFLPVEFFKTHKVVCGSTDNKIIFTSSGTTGIQTSRHYVKNIEIYKQSFTQTFNRFYGTPKDYCILALLPSYLERQGSSLVYMVEELINQTSNINSRFYLHNHKELHNKLIELESKKQKTLLIGVSFALLDFFEKYKMNLQNTIIMETGGMKGKKKEMIRKELHETLMKASKVSSIHSEYGMTELLSQAYSVGNSIFKAPPYMKILIRDTNDPYCYLEKGRSGGINVIDLANINSCSFIETKDLGRLYNDENFEVVGRFDNSDIRGCNLMAG